VPLAQSPWCSRSALGAYHAGAFEKLHEAGITPAWIAGSSVGAITAAIIAGTGRSECLRALREFWRIAA
jgi:NTE family protein